MNKRQPKTGDKIVLTGTINGMVAEFPHGYESSRNVVIRLSSLHKDCYEITPNIPPEPKGVGSVVVVKRETGALVSYTREDTPVSRRWEDTKTGYRYPYAEVMAGVDSVEYIHDTAEDKK